MQFRQGDNHICFTLIEERPFDVAVPNYMIEGVMNPINYGIDLIPDLGPYEIKISYDSNGLIPCETGNEDECNLRLLRWCSDPIDNCWNENSCDITGDCPKWIDTTDWGAYWPGLDVDVPIGLDYPDNVVTGYIEQA